jgi:branched-chain amino acid transport system substrate-binding protein
VSSETFYWDLDDETRAWSKRYMARMPGKVPNMVHAGVYASVRHYLRAVAAVGSDDAAAVTAAMKATPVNDFYNKDVTIRADGHVLHRIHAFRVKAPAESTYPFDYYERLESLPGEAVAMPMSEGGCPFVQQQQQ